MKIMHAMYSQHNSSKKPGINQICVECAEKLGMRIPEGHIASFWGDPCDACGELKEVTDITDFKKTNNGNT
jgi:hypothetical protein